jgi:hypothetical protein
MSFCFPNQCTCPFNFFFSLSFPVISVSFFSSYFPSFFIYFSVLLLQHGLISLQRVLKHKNQSLKSLSYILLQTVSRKNPLSTPYLTASILKLIHLLLVLNSMRCIIDHQEQRRVSAGAKNGKNTQTYLDSVISQQQKIAHKLILSHGLQRRTSFLTLNTIAN